MGHAQDLADWHSVDAAGGGFDSSAIGLLYSSVGQHFASMDSSAAGILYSGFVSIFVAKASGPSLILSATTIDFGVVTVNTPSKKSVTLSAAGTADITLENQRVNGAGFRLATAAPSAIMAGTPGTAEIEFTPPSSGDFTGTYTFTSNDPAKPSVTIQLKGTGSVTTRSKLSLSTPSLDFGSVPVFSSKEMVLTIANIGNADLIITAQTLIGPDAAEFFITQAASGTVAPNGTTTLAVSHTPKAAGSKTASIRIESNDPASPTTPVILVSNAVTDAVGAASLPRGMALQSGYPNPFIASLHRTMTFTYQTDRAADIDLCIFDALGRKMATLASGRRSAGSHHAFFVPDAGLPAGVYTAALRIGTDASQNVLTRAFMLMK